MYKTNTEIAKEIKAYRQKRKKGYIKQKRKRTKRDKEYEQDKDQFVVLLPNI